MDSNIQKLINLTTIVKVVNNICHQTIFGDGYLVSRFQRDQGQQIDLGNLEQNWENKWESFGNEWNKERQNYRFLYDSFKLFYFSFEQLRFNKVAFINESFGNTLRMLHLNELTGVSLYGMYHHGKKCVDLIKTLKLINEEHSGWNFCNKFSETRNKLIEHNFNPAGLDFQIDPSIWSLGATDSLMKISIHTKTKERVYDVYVDYYEDYYRLEKIIVDIIKKF